MTPANTVVFDDAAALARGVAQWLLEKAGSVERPFSICLSGGTTPRHLYGLLASPDFVADFPWNRVHWFWGDERWVPHDHPRSNYRMVKEAMLDHAPVPSGNVHPVPFDATSAPRAAAQLYDRALRAAVGQSGKRLFDVTFLGLGDDGHTASLFPNSPALNERVAWACAAPGPDHETRITLTYPALENSEDTAFLVAGAGKGPALAAVWRGADLPAARLKPAGTLHWFLDQAAADAASRAAP